VTRGILVSFFSSAYLYAYTQRVIPSDLGSRSEHRGATVLNGSSRPRSWLRAETLHREQLMSPTTCRCSTRCAGSPNFSTPYHKASGATCVQKLDGSRDSAIHTRYRILLRSSSMREPRYPLPRVVLVKIA